MTNSTERSALIVAGGTGNRFGSALPKQFLVVAGKPVLMHTILKFYNFDPSINIVVVLPFEFIDTWNQLCSSHRFIVPHRIVKGGEERYDSVKKGLDIIDPTGIVAIHDGVRPCVSDAIIANSFFLAEKYGAAIPVVPVIQSLRENAAGSTKPVDRSKLCFVQTPQTFVARLIKEAYKLPNDPGFTDDATVFEAAGESVHVFDGEENNLKITTSIDLKLAELMLGQTT